MRILFTIRSLTGGGAERVVSVLSGLLADNGEDVHIITYKKTDRDYSISENVQIHEMPQRKDSPVTKGLRIFDMRKIIKDVQPDVIIPFVGTVLYVSWLAIIGMKIPFVLTIRNNPWTMPEKKASRRFRDYLAKKSCAIMVQNEEQSEYFSEYLKKKCFVVPNPISIKFINNYKEDYSTKISRMIAVGRLHEQKNYPLLLKAVVGIIKNKPESTLDIFGEGNQKEYLERLIAEYGLEDNVFLRGRSQNIEEQLKTADLFIMTSDYEGMPNALMEAMAYGVPCISSDCKTGPKSLIRPFENGLLFQTGNIDDLKEKIEWAITNSNKMIKYGKLARCRLLEDYSSGKALENMQALLKYVKESKMSEKKHGMRRVAGYLVNHRMINWMPDKPYLKVFYYAEFGKFIDFKNPKTFNEKLNWLKLYYRKPELITLVDKYEVKKYIADKIGDQYVIPTLGVWDKFADINFDELPNQFVLKCTHDSGGLVVCKDRSKLNLEEAKAKIEKSLANNYYLWTREWPYKGVKPRIIAEKYMEDQETRELRDYKFFCFNGEPKLMFVATERGTKNTKFDFYDMQFNHMNIVQHYPNSKSSIKKPEHFEKMVMLAKKLSVGFPHVRVDFYEANGRVYFGEMTFYHFGAIVPFETKEWDEKIGDWLELPEKMVNL